MNRRGLLRGVRLAGGAVAAAGVGGAVTRLYDTAHSSSAPSSSMPSSSAPSSAAPSTGWAPGGGTLGGQTITEDFFGLTTDGKLIDGLFPVRSDGVDTAPVVAAAQAFLAALTDDQKKKTQYTAQSTEWRMWSNLDPGGYPRQGVSLADLNDTQKNLWKTAMLQAALSAQGLDTTDRIRRINLAAGQLVGKSDTFNDVLYYVTVMGTPSATEPWGFQFDGHHLVVNYFVLGDQVVMTPSFWGTEPTSLQIDGQTVTACQEEVAASLAFIQSLTPAQQHTTIISATKADEDMKAGAFADNAVQAYAGIPTTRCRTRRRRNCSPSRRYSPPAPRTTSRRCGWPRSAATSTTPTLRGSAAPATPTPSTCASTARSCGSRSTARPPAPSAAPTARPAPTAPPSCTSTPSPAPPTATTTAETSSASTTSPRRTTSDGRVTTRNDALSAPKEPHPAALAR